MGGRVLGVRRHRLTRTMSILDLGLNIPHMADGYGLEKKPERVLGSCDQPQADARLQADRRSRTGLL